MQAHDLAVVATASLPRKGRKLRKGTCSCQECKRRKRKCEFQPNQSKCLLCRRLELPCVAQQASEETSDAPDRRRIDHIESLVTQLLVRQGLGPLHRASGSLSAFGLSLADHLGAFLPPSETMALIRNQGRSPFEEYWRPKTELTPRSMLHPAYFARTLLELALCLNHVGHKTLHYPGVQNRLASETAYRYAEAAKQITTQDHLVQSTVGLEALLLQGCYNAQTRREHAAWLTFRRACSLGHLMQKQPDYSSSGHDGELWFRIVFSDRFASLILGLPCVSNDYVLETCHAEPAACLRNLEHAHVIIAGQIIARNCQLASRLQTVNQEMDYELQDIDNNLKRAARAFPRSWWAVAAPTAYLSLSAIDLSTQIHHYHLVLLAHLPHILQALLYEHATSHAIPHSILAGLSSSRELLSRIQLMRQLPRAPNSMSAMKHKAHLAAAILLLIHISVHTLGAMTVFEHQRPGDLFLAEKAVEVLEADGGLYDVEKQLSIDIVGLRKMLEVEDQAAEGVSYTITATEPMGGEHVDITFELPYFGVLLIKRDCPLAEISSLEDILPRNIGLSGPNPAILGESILAGGNTETHLDDILVL